MKTVIYTFSGTGNSLAAARAMAVRLGECEVRMIPQEMREGRRKAEADRIGFVFPLYYVGIPRVVQEFIRTLDLVDVQYIFTVVTKGWPIVGGAIHQMKHLLKAKGCLLNAGFYLQLPMNDITLVGVADPKTQAKLLAKAPSIINRMAETVRTNRKRFDPEILWFLWRLRNIPFCARVQREDRLFSAEASCIGCGTCAKVCPVRDIVIVDSRPRWQGQCEQCLACFHFCPKKAIRFDGRGGDQPQYHHPEATLKALTDCSPRP